MRIKRLRLKNIRSYEELSLDFKPGTTLLSGDIGSGKTTILLSIEFALFGSLKGILQANNLLRRGCSEGFIELNFELNNEDVTIFRSLKVQNNKIIQKENTLKIGDEEESLTPVDIKSKVLKLLGYPEELVTKSKSLIYRYTVYTPQEEMKVILFENKNDRLEKIRKIIGVDKYKTISDNATEHVKDLKQEIKELHIKTEDLEDLVTKKNEKEEEMKKNDEEIMFLEKLSREERERYGLKKEFYEELEKKILAYKEWEQNEKIKELKIKNIKDKLNELKNENVHIQENIDDEKLEDLPKPNPVEIEEKLRRINLNLKTLEDNLIIVKNKKAITENKNKESEELMININDLETCPKCYQEVTENHKQKIIREEKHNIKLQEEKIKKYDEFIKKALEQKEKFEKKKKEYEEEKYENVKLLQKIKNYEEKKKRIEKSKEQLKANKEKIKSLDYELQVLEKKPQQPVNPEKEWEEVKKELEEIKENFYSIDSKIKAKKELKEYHEKEVKYYWKEIDKRKRIKEILVEKEMHKTWMTNHLIKLSNDIEKSVLAKIYKEFNEYFTSWFEDLLEDENLQADLDEEFNPRIIQNGYEAKLEDLSGGEKTAVALAYRLALNKVINNYVGNMKTTDLLILDEPTDGFSSDQLDSLRDVLEEMNTEQIIIVSHETKMESMVENIIKINKHEHVSSVE